MSLPGEIGPSCEAPEIEVLRKQLVQRSAVMQEHEVFGRIRSLEHLRRFMSWHVFAVWDFMSLAKRLQHECTSMSLPWTPPPAASASRLINEIVLGEESDSTPDGGHASHYELYLSAMREVGADTQRVERLVDLVRGHIELDVALSMAGVPAPVAEFVRATLACAMRGSPFEVLGSFVYGREQVIPRMFTTLLSRWSIPRQQTPVFVHYLRRHIELDGDSHGPAALRLVAELTGGSTARLGEVYRAAVAAVEQRIALWDALAVELAQ